VAPYVAGKLGENVSIHAPFWMGAAAVLVGAAVLYVGRRTLQGRPHAVEPAATPEQRREDEAALLAVGDLD
jgi:hypothetical protein